MVESQNSHANHDCTPTSDARVAGEIPSHAAPANRRPTTKVSASWCKQASLVACTMHLLQTTTEARHSYGRQTAGLLLNRSKRQSQSWSSVHEGKDAGIELVAEVIVCNSRADYKSHTERDDAEVGVRRAGRGRKWEKREWSSNGIACQARADRG